MKEQTIFHHKGNTIHTEDRTIQILAQFEDPLIVVLDHVLNHEECDELMQMSKERLHRSKIGTTRDVHAIRTSRGMFFQEGESELVDRIEKRLSQIMNIPVEHGEGLHILHYQVGQEYEDHVDYFSSPRMGNNRISTLVLYLNDVEEGGETVFPKLNVSVSPKKGMAVYFEYFYQDEALNALTLHRGAPVIQGEKWVATQWMWRQKYR